MKIDKVNNTFNTYKLELSFGELVGIMNVLEDVHAADPVVDEMKEGIRWYLDHLPGPGEDREDFKAKKEAEKAVGVGGEPGEPPEAETTSPADLALPPEKSGPDMEPKGEEDLDKVLAKPPAE